MNLENIKQKIRKQKYKLSFHALEEAFKDKLEESDIEESLTNAVILEDYPEDKRGHSCLLVGWNKNGRPLHSVCGNLDGEELLIITVYIPIFPKWITPLKRG